MTVDIHSMGCEIVSASIGWSTHEINLEHVFALYWDLLRILILQMCWFQIFALFLIDKVCGTLLNVTANQLLVQLLRIDGDYTNMEL